MPIDNFSEKANGDNSLGFFIDADYEKRIDYFDARKLYYQIPMTQALLVANMLDREVWLIHNKEKNKAINGLWIRETEYLRKTFDRFHFFENDRNILISCAKYKYIPPFTTFLKLRASQVSEWFERMGPVNAYAFDILFDLDSKYGGVQVDIDASKLSSLLSKYKIGHTINYSSDSGGKHLVVDGKFTQSYFLRGQDRFFPMVKSIISRCSDIMRLDTVDREVRNGETISVKMADNIRKIRKCPYSLVNGFPIGNIITVDFAYNECDFEGFLRFIGVKY